MSKSGRHLSVRRWAIAGGIVGLTALVMMLVWPTDRGPRSKESRHTQRTEEPPRVLAPEAAEAAPNAPGGEVQQTPPAAASARRLLLPLMELPWRTEAADAPGKAGDSATTKPGRIARLPYGEATGGDADRIARLERFEAGNRGGTAQVELPLDRPNGKIADVRSAVDHSPNTPAMFLPPNLQGKALSHEELVAHYMNRHRDYRISIREQATGKGVGDFSGFDQQPELARARCRDFWSGGYFRFLVRGPRQLTIQVNRNSSFNTILAAVALDRVEEQPQEYFGSLEGKLSEATTRQVTASTATPAAVHATVTGATAAQEDRAAKEIRDLLATFEAKRPAWHATEGRRYYAALARWYQQAAITPDATPVYRQVLASCYYQLRRYAQWEEQQRKLGLVTARQIEQALRWDGKANTYPSENREMIQAYRAARLTPTTVPATGSPKPE